MALLLQRLTYQLLLWLVLPFIPLRLLVRGFREKGYWRDIAERFGFGRVAADQPVWIHAVSVGEVRAAQPLVDGLLAQGKPVLVTCMTPAGRLTAEQLYGPRAAVRYLPYDYAWAIRRFLRDVRPTKGVIMETELWPNLVREANRARFPLHLVNARLSEKSARGYRLFAALTRAVLQGFSGVAAQTEADAVRLSALGASGVTVTGNLKFDIDPALGQLELGGKFRELIGNRPIWLAASTRDGEEKLILQAFRNGAPPHVLLVLVPRHPQRFDEVAQLARDFGFLVQRRSENAPVNSGTQVWLGDSLGEMFAYYAAADSALIGGSLLPHGGQNLIEACAVGCPVLAGPHTENFMLVAEQAVEQGAALRIRDAEEWANWATRLSSNDSLRQRMGEAGKRFSAAHKGAAKKVLQLIGNSAGR